MPSCGVRPFPYHTKLEARLDSLGDFLDRTKGDTP